MTGALVVAAAFLLIAAAITVLAFGPWGLAVVTVAFGVSAVAVKHLNRSQPL